MDRRARVQAGVQFGRGGGEGGGVGGGGGRDRAHHSHVRGGLSEYNDINRNNNVNGGNVNNNGESREYEYSVNALPKDCATSNYKRMIHDPGTWRFLQDTYIDTAETLHSKRYVRRKQHQKRGGFTVDVIVKDDGYRGRSVYAAQPIERGTKVWSDTNLVHFDSPFELKSFLGFLDHDLQCDALLWAYVEKGEGYVSLALDEGSFVNHGESTAEGEDLINLDKDCYALRDIRMGEELLENYTEFIGFHEVEWFDEIRGMAWKEEEKKKIESKKGVVTVGKEEPPALLIAQSTDGYNKFGAPKLLGNNNGNGNNNDDTTSSASGISQSLLAVTILIVGVYALKKIFPNHLLKKEKEGI